MSAYLRSASSALEMLRPMQGHSAPPATSTTHQLAAQPRKVRLSFRKRSTDVEKGAHQFWRFATTALASYISSGRVAMRIFYYINRSAILFYSYYVLEASSQSFVVKRYGANKCVS